jgi:hypothetical protein
MSIGGLRAAAIALCFFLPGCVLPVTPPLSMAAPIGQPIPVAHYYGIIISVSNLTPGVPFSSGHAIGQVAAAGVSDDMPFQQVAAAGVSDMSFEQIAEVPRVHTRPIRSYRRSRGYGGYRGGNYDDAGEVIGEALGNLFQAMARPPVAAYGAALPPPPTVRYTIMLDRGPVVAVSQYVAVPYLGPGQRAVLRVEGGFGEIVQEDPVLHAYQARLGSWPPTPPLVPMPPFEPARLASPPLPHLNCGVPHTGGEVTCYERPL